MAVSSMSGSSVWELPPLFPSVFSASATPSPPQVARPAGNKAKNKHGFFKIWHRNVSNELRRAYDAVYGMPLYGSLAFISVRNSTGFRSITCTVNSRFEGPAVASTRTRAGSTGAVLRIHAMSGGKDDGDVARITVNGTEFSSNTRGLNIIVLDCMSGSVVSRCTFDTHGSPAEAKRLIEFIDDLPVGQIVVGAVRDDAAKFLLEDGRRSLRQVGVPVPSADDVHRLGAVLPFLPPDRTQVLLTVCAKSNAARCALLLLKSGWDVGFRAAHTLNTPLHDAVYQSNADVASVLLENGACVKALNRWSESAADIARIRHGFGSLDELLLDRSSPVQSVVRFLNL